MAKLKLQIESLEVETFETAEKEERRGTVRGHGETEPDHCTGGDFCTAPYQCAAGSYSCTIVIDSCPTRGHQYCPDDVRPIDTSI